MALGFRQRSQANRRTELRRQPRQAVAAIMLCWSVFARAMHLVITFEKTLNNNCYLSKHVEDASNRTHHKQQQMNVTETQTQKLERLEKENAALKLAVTEAIIGKMHLTGPIISSNNIQQHEQQQQMNVTETQTQKLERLEKENAALKAALAKEPQPSQYGLDEEVMKFFSSMPRTLKSVPSILPWVVFFGLLLLTGKHFDLLFWPIFGLSFLLVLLAGMTANILIERHFENSKKKHRLYRNWQGYLAAHSEWQRIQFKEQEAERARQTLLVKQREEEQRRQLNWWKSLNGKQFEKELAGLLTKRGYWCRYLYYRGHKTHSGTMQSAQQLH